MVQVEVRVEVTGVMDELQRFLGGSAIGLEYGWHEDEAVGVALTELLISVLQMVKQPLVLGCLPGFGGGLAHPWLVALATRWVMETSSTMWVPMFGKSLMMTSGMYLAFAVTPQCLFWVCVGEVGARGGQACFLGKAHEEGDHFLMALVCSAVGPAASRVGGAEVNLVASTSASFAAADSEGDTQPEL
jgi:hypothetical protein